MPLYEYACRSCGHQFEEVVKAGEKPPCPVCQSLELEKAFSVFAVGKGGGSTARMESAMPAGCGRCNEPGASCPYGDN